MPRRSPRSRPTPSREPRLPGRARPRATPGKGRTAERAGRRRRGAAHPAPAAPRPRPPAPRARPAPPRRPRPPRAARTARFRRPEPERVAAIVAILERLYPDARTALRHQGPLQLLIATILSAQCTDERVNQVTPALFARYPDAAAFAAAAREELEALIRSTGFFRNKAAAILSCCRDLVERHGGRVPGSLDELVLLRGVGRKTANVVLGDAFGVPGVVVDTHVTRLSNRLGLVRSTDPVEIEHRLMELLPRERWTAFSHWLILHGRRVCIARKPRCSICPLLPHCPRYGVTVSQ